MVRIQSCRDKKANNFGFGEYAKHGEIIVYNHFLKLRDFCKNERGIKNGNPVRLAITGS